MDDKSIKEIYEKYSRMIDKYDLISFKIDDVKIWEYSQFQVFNKILTELGVFSNAHSVPSLVKRITRLPMNVINFIVKNPLYGNYRKDILVFNNPRKTLIDEEYIDIYTEYYIEELNSQQYELIENPYMNTHYKCKRTKQTKYLDALKIIYSIKKHFIHIQLSEEDVQIISLIENEIENSFDIKLDIMNLFITNLKRFKIYFDYYNKLLVKRNPKVIFLVTHYFYQELISAAKKNHIPVIEIQHGVITPYSVSYNFPYSKYSVELFPDKLFMFGSYWTEAVKLPLESNNIISMGYPFLNKQIDKYKNRNKISTDVLLLSQGTIGKYLFKITIELAKLMPSYNFIYKLHPGEVYDWRNKYYDEDDKIVIPENLKILENDPKDLYYYFSTCEYVLGVYSTALFEGLAFDCKCILVNLPGIEYMEPLMKLANIPLCNNSQEIKESIIKDKHNLNISKENIFDNINYKDTFINIVEYYRKCGK